MAVIDQARGEVDVAIIGCGPAGATAANILASSGLKVLVLEREIFPRFRVGESLLPYSNPILRRLGVWSQLKAAGAVVKRGATFENRDGNRRARIDFSVLGHEDVATSFHIERSRFDELLLKRAEAAGAEVVQGALVEGCQLDGTLACIQWREQEQPQRVSARYVIDASGRAGVLARRFAGWKMDPTFKKVALFAHFQGGRSVAGVAAGDIRIIMAERDGWGWQIPLGGQLSSVGFVYDGTKGVAKSESKEEFFARRLREVPALGQALEGAERCGPVRSASDYSFHAEQMAGSGWALVGDACGFLDPVFSTGVHFALVHAAEVADALVAGFETGLLLDASLLQSVSMRQRRRYARYRKFVEGFYELGQRELLLEPESWPEGALAVTRVLAGCDNLGIRDGVRIQGFHLLAQLRTPRS